MLKYLRALIPQVGMYSLVALFFGIWFIGVISPYHLLAVVAIVLILASRATHQGLTEELRPALGNAVKHKEKAQKDEEIWKQSLIEKSSGFPTLFKAIEEYEEKEDRKTSYYLLSKSHPAKKASQIVQEEARRRREAEFAYKNTRAIIEYYENIAPFLLDYRDDIEEEKEDYILREYSEEERDDPVTNFLTKEEFRKLPSVERNQMALDRFWQRPKPRWLIGRVYERYIGYLYEEKGYDVEYVGIFRGYEDLGRDLICGKQNDITVIQCKYWSQFRTIYEKHIFQFFGTVFQYRDENPDKKVKAIFYTSTTLSELARRFANELHIDLNENFKFDQAYPSIKCNVSRIDGSKIYHLPFDQQYDKTKIEKHRAEFYCRTVKEAEDTGFRRAFRWRGEKEGGE